MKIYKYNIAILILYFGDKPWYFDYFIHTCKYNQSIDFIIISDNLTYDSKIPENIFFIYKTFKEIRILIKEKLQMEIALDYPYKICDFRPAYGLIFSEVLSGYDFWGMGDIDVVFGNIRKFITDEILENYDVISVRHDFLVGYFTLFRNCELVNRLYKQSKDYKKVFTNQEHFCFDESNFAYLKMDDVITFEEVDCEIDSMTHVVKRLHNQKVINAYFDAHVIEGLPGKLKWENGNLIYKQEYEVVLYHMIQFKKIYHEIPPKNIPNMFRISPSRIY